MINFISAYPSVILRQRSLPSSKELSLSFVSQVKAAESRGAIGVLLYVDPEDVAPNGYSSKNTYPDKPWMSKDAVFSKDLSLQLGDLLTPNFPSIPGMYRMPRNESALPRIPAQPISYGDALHLFSLLKGAFVLGCVMI